MIDWTKPVRWVDDKERASVWMTDADGSAWVKSPDGRAAYLFDKYGKRPYVTSVENIPEPPKEPIVSWLVAFMSEAVLSYYKNSSAVDVFNDGASRALALLKLTYVPGHASVEIIEERK